MVLPRRTTCSKSTNHDFIRDLSSARLSILDFRSSMPCCIVRISASCLNFSSESLSAAWFSS
uniref:Uncharacterized protein n=1 Tax=Arundo donax TaxID=35708 RepID=A0A0A9FI61_ARUDO